MTRNIKTTLALLLSLCACARQVAVRSDTERFDVIIANGTVIDGTGTAGYRADIALRGDRIVRVSREPLPQSGAARVIDAAGMVVSPGFIDLHSHLEPLLDMPDAESRVRQGVTTALGGPDGGGPLPLAAYFDSLSNVRLGLNVAYLVGHNTVRERVMGLRAGAPSGAELERMKQLVAQAMADGAFGMSTGLIYLPGTFANTDEVVALAAVAAASGGIYTSHLREEGLGLFDGVAEALEIGRRARIPIVLTHHKAVGEKMWGSSTRTLAMMDSARRAGTDVSVDQYPYTATSTGISVLVPSWALAGGDSAFKRRVSDRVLRDSITAGIVFNILNDRGGGDLRRVQFANVAWMPELNGKTLYDWATMRGVPTTPASGAQLVIEAVERGGASAIYHVLSETDVERIMQHPQTIIASDGRLARPGEGAPHPRAYGTFPRVLGRYVREKKLLTLEAAVAKMTGMPAARLGVTDRGRIAEGLHADITVFDPATVLDRATFEDPHQYPAGIPYVIVNGVVTVDNGTFTAARAGRTIKRSARPAT